MANFFSTQITSLNASPPVRVKVNLLQARIRIAIGQYTVPASPPAIADIVYLTRVPRGARILGNLSQLNFSAGQASETLNVGDNVTAARHLAATSVTAAGTAVPQAAMANGVTGYETTDETRDGTGLASSTNDCDLRSTVAGAAMVAAQVVALHVAFAQD